MGDEEPSFIRTLIEECAARGTLRENEWDIKGSGGTAYVGTCLHCAPRVWLTQLAAQPAGLDAVCENV